MKSLRVTVELVDGTVTGVRRASIQHRSARAIAVPYAALRADSDWEELTKPGVYFLLGYLKAGPTVYVGQTNHLMDRLRTHRNRTNWHELIAVTSSDDWLTIAHTHVLESRCYRRCLASRYFLQNAQEPRESQISAHDRQAIEEFLQHMVCLTRCLGYDFLMDEPDASQTEVVSTSPGNQTKSQSKAGVPSIQDIFLPGSGAPPPPVKHEALVQPSHSPVQFPIVCTNKRNRQATMHAWPGRHVVKAGSLLRKESPELMEDPVQAWMPKYRKELVQLGRLEPVANALRTVTDIEFKSPSGCSCFVTGTSSNGWQDWIDSAGRPLQHYRKALK